MMYRCFHSLMIIIKDDKNLNKFHFFKEYLKNSMISTYGFKSLKINKFNIASTHMYKLN